MQNIKAKKESIEQVTGKLNASKVVEKTLLNINWEEILKSHKYSRKEFKNGKWIYYYDKNNNHSRMTQCKTSLLNITYDKNLDPEIQTAMITGQAIDYIENVWLADWEETGNENKSICKELRNKKIIFGDISYTHLWKQGGNSQGGAKIRSPKNIMEHVPYLPCAKELLEDNGVWTESRYEPINKKHSRAIGIIYQTLSGIAPKGSPKPYVSVTISQYKYKNGKKGDALYISVVGKDDIKKSLDKKNGIDLSEGGNKSFATKAAFCLTSPKSKPNLIIQKSNNMSSKIKPDYDGKNVLHKSFDIVVTDITENNKRQKVEQVEKALNAMYTNTPFVIKHIKADSSPRYDDIILRISDFDRNKIEKAVHNMAFSLDTTVKNSKGEAFIYKAQEDLTDKWTAFFSSYVKGVYNFVVSYFGLPEITVMRKADADLTYKGKVLYSPETGKPIKESEWKRFCELLEKFLNRKIKDADKKIILESASLGKILNRMLKYNTLETVTKQRLDDIKYHGKKLEWISDTVQNMESATKTPLTRYEQARLQVMTQSAGNRITGITERMKMDVQQILIDGVKDRKSKSVISQNLFDKMTGENRDFQRIADTEIQNAVNNGFLLEEVHNSEEGEKVYFRRVEIMDENTCPYCSKINGLVAVWSETPVEGAPKDEYAKAVIWEGKDWNGKKLTSFDEVPCGPCHPYCRGSWTRWTPGRTARIDAMVAQITGKGKKWHEAVNEAREEFRAKGIEEPSDATKGYTDRINELYEEKLK